MFHFHLPHPNDVFNFHHGWVLYLVVYTLLSLPVVALLPPRWRKYWFATSGGLILAAIFTLPVAFWILVTLVIIHQLPRLLYYSGAVTPWKPGFRAITAWGFLCIFLGLYYLLDSPEVDFMYIAHWSGIAYGLPRAVDYVAARMEGRLTDTGFWGLLSYMLYIPALFQGPIARSDDFLEGETFRVTLRAIPNSLWLMFFGWVKYSAAIMIFQVHPAGFLHPGVTPAGTWFDVTFNLFITPLSGYLFFAAYTDAARAMSALLGKELPENFRNPFFTVSFRRFWRDYHISLTSWLRDFIYIPQGGNRRRAAINGLAVFIFIGLWHKPVMAFVIWGSTQWLAVYIEQQLVNLRKRNRRFDELLSLRSFGVATFPLRLAIFWTVHAFSWSFFYGGYDGAISTLAKILQFS